MKKIYLILTHTGTTLSTIIKCYTKDEFSHVSIALDKELNTMYSFGRLRPNNPFIGGFVHEGIDFGTFKRFKNTQSEIYSLEIADNKYEKIKEEIKKFESNKEKYKFNIIGLFAVSINKKIHYKNTFYCAEFVKYLFEKVKIDNNLPDIIRPQDFKKLKDIELVYSGKLKDYKKNELTDKITLIEEEKEVIEK